MSRFVAEFNEDVLSNEYVNWLRHYGKGRNREDIRFGQHLVNLYLDFSKGSFPELFYTENASDAFSIAYGELNEH